MDETKHTLLKEVMAADFTTIDLALYLNTHPTDQKAYILYRASVLNAKKIREKYERQYGPLTVDSPYNTFPWKWVQTPWPWEKD